MCVGNFHSRWPISVRAAGRCLFPRSYQVVSFYLTATANRSKPYRLLSSCRRRLRSVPHFAKRGWVKCFVFFILFTVKCRLSTEPWMIRAKSTLTKRDWPCRRVRGLKSSSKWTMPLHQCLPLVSPWVFVRRSVNSFTRIPVCEVGLPSRLF